MTDLLWTVYSIGSSEPIVVGMLPQPGPEITRAMRAPNLSVTPAEWAPGMWMWRCDKHRRRLGECSCE